MKQILVVDDDAQLLKAMTRILSKEFVVVSTTSAYIGLILAGQKTFAAVLSDVSMPEMNGFDFREALLKAVPSLEGRILFVSGGGSTLALDRRLMGFEHVEKPFTRVELLAAVRKITDDGGDPHLPGLPKSDGTAAQ